MKFDAAKIAIESQAEKQGIKRMIIHNRHPLFSLSKQPKTGVSVKNKN